MKQHRLFLHGRPSPHPIHKAYGEAVCQKSDFIDPRIRWHDLNISPLSRYRAFFINAKYLAMHYNPDLILSEGFHFTPILIKLFKPRCRIIFLLDDEGLYFFHAHQYPKITRIFFKLFLKKCDGAICVGDFQNDLFKKICNKPSLTVRNGIEDSRLNQLLRVKTNLQSNRILFIGNGSDGWRTWYKGLDIMISAMAELKNKFPDLVFTIVGEWTSTEQDGLLKQYPRSVDYVKFAGKQQYLIPYLEQASLYLHVARGEAWGISVTEAMAAGLPSVVSNITGSMEIIREVDERLIIAPEVNEIVKTIKWYFSLGIKEKKLLGEQLRTRVTHLTQSSSVANFKAKFEQLVATLE